MIRPPDKSVTIALCLSLALHTALYVAIILSYVHENSGGVIFRGLTPQELADEQARREESPATLPTYLIPVPRDNEMGLSDGTGRAANASPGDEPMKARQGSQEQAWLSRDDQGFGSPDNLPSKSSLPEGMNGEGGAGGNGGKNQTGNQDLLVSAAPFGAQPPKTDDEIMPARKPPKESSIASEKPSKIPPAETAEKPKDEPKPESNNKATETVESKHPPVEPTETAKLPEKSDAPETPKPPPVEVARAEPPPTSPPEKPEKPRHVDADLPVVALLPTTVPADVKPDEKKPVEVALATPAPPPPPPSSPPPPAAEKAPPAASEEHPSRAAASGAPGTPGAPVPSADPAPQSDSESDAFSNVGSANFAPGRVTARFGRKVKTVRPRLTEAGKWDLAGMGGASVVFRVKVDETGKVTSVDVLRSSGSNNIDLPCRRAMYEWWIEPAKDKDGKAIPDVMVWTLAFR